MEPAVEPSGAVDVQQVVLEIISERTGYPVDMIEPDLDLEADLSIDSIKRAEIAGELARRLGAGADADLAALDDDALEELAKARTAAAVTDWLTARLGGPAEQAAAPTEPAAPPVPEPGPGPDAVTGEAPGRRLLRPVLLDERPGAPSTRRPRSPAPAGSSSATLPRPPPGWRPTAPTSPYAPVITS